MKRVLSAFFCMALLFCVGCANSQPTSLLSFSVSTESKLTPSQYKAALEERWEAYLNANRNWVALMSDKQDCDDPNELAKLRPQIDPIFDRMEEALVSYDDIIPPDEYKELNQKLLEGVDSELEWLNYARQSFRVTTRSELDTLNEKADELLDRVTENGTSYPIAYFNLYMAMKNDGVE
ncbi:MAG: hypothetical protein ACI4KM_05315 [Oscillospiraceae bacterium]